MQIYKITNLITNLSYIGKNENDNNKYYMGSGILLWNSYRKRFGNDKLDSKRRSDHKWVYEQNIKYHYYKKDIIATCNNKEELCKLEKFYINKYNTIRPNGYNIAEGGDGGNLIKGYTEIEKQEWKNKISQKTKEAMQRPEIKEKISKIIKTEEWKNNISKSLTGKPVHPQSEKTKKILREINLNNKYGIGNKSRTGYHNSEEMNKKISESGKKVIHTAEWNKHVSQSLKGKPKSEAHKQALRKPKPKYKWKLPDESIKIMDAANGSKHKDWIKLERIS
jgi:hypothetical protein|nr:MAG TPA: GIY-YIG nuclease superfamily protein [Caudoviricetes sp.]